MDGITRKAFIERWCMDGDQAQFVADLDVLLDEANEAGYMDGSAEGFDEGYIVGSDN